MLRPRLWLFALLALPACHTRSVSGDGGLDAAGSDGPTADVPGTLALDFAATGCARVDAGAAHADGGAPLCTGSSPLTLTFSPVSSAALTRFRWTFGDGSAPSTERAPVHTYLLPGTYDVALVAEGAVGSLSREHAQFVEVTSVATGAPCDVDSQCTPGLFCLCGEGAPCGGAFLRGVCTRACPAAGCGVGATCARVEVPPRLATTTSPVGADASSDAPFDAASKDGASDAPLDAAKDAADAAAPIADAGDASAPSDARDAASAEDGDDAGAISRPLCLAGCAGDADCAADLVCRPLPGTAAGGSWTSACVPPFFRRIGDSCRDAQGQLDDELCATHQCVALGALGLCSASCADGAPCPVGSACATFGDGRALCLALCSKSAPCTSDPLLGCEAGSGGGALGFLTSPPAPTATLCAPRTCTSQADCAPSGTCKPLGVGAHCAAN